MKSHLCKVKLNCKFTKITFCLAFPFHQNIELELLPNVCVWVCVCVCERTTKRLRVHLSTVDRFKFFIRIEISETRLKVLAGRQGGQKCRSGQELFRFPLLFRKNRASYGIIFLALNSIRCRYSKNKLLCQ